jgi:hypothetical protein
MRVRLLTAIAGTPSYAAGDVVELQDALALIWTSAGIAERVDASVCDVETAVVAVPVETATQGRRRRR